MVPEVMNDPRVLHGDCRDMLLRVPAASVDACVTDPPYGLTAASRNGSSRTPGTGPFGRHTLGTDRGFMGMTWDGAGVAFDPDTWRAVARTLKPGAPLLVFGGTRTWHKLLGALTAADLVIHATVGWIYSSGFIKSLDATRAICERTGTSAPPEWRGWGTALKPAWEPIVVASMPGGTPPALPPVIYTGKAPPQERPQVNGIAHPTVKPLTLIRQLVQVTTPRDGLVLDPFLGSGTLAEAAIAEGRRFVGCEDHAGYLPLIQHRISRAEQGLIPGTHRWERARRAAEERRLIATSGQLDLFSAL